MNYTHFLQNIFPMRFIMIDNGELIIISNRLEVLSFDLMNDCYNIESLKHKKIK